MEYLIISAILNLAFIAIILIERNHSNKLEQKYLQCHEESNRWSKAYVELWNIHYKLNTKLPTIKPLSGKTTLYMIKGSNENIKA